jgi:hypothetical protein
MNKVSTDKLPRKHFSKFDSICALPRLEYDPSSKELTEKNENSLRDSQKELI